MCRSMLEDTPGSVAVFRSALRQLANGASDKVHPLHGVPLAAVLLDAWRAAATATPGPPAEMPRAALPVPTPADAADAANLLERALRPLSTPLPLTELNHAADAGPSALVAIGAKWRTRTPYVLTEHHTYLDAPLLDHTYGLPAVRAALLCFLRALARVAYHEAGVVAAPTEQLRRWAQDHGADRDRLVLAPYGVDPYACTLIRGEPAEPTITWLGPDRDLSTMIAALPEIRHAKHGVRVLVAGPATAISDRRHTEAIGFLGPVSHRRSAYANGQIVVLAAGDDSMPYALIEAMMCGRPTIVIDDGTLANAVGLGALTVPPDNPHALASAVITLLSDPARRKQLSVAAGQRARNLFALRSSLDRFREVYERAARDTSAATEPILPLPIADSPDALSPAAEAPAAAGEATPPAVAPIAAPVARRTPRPTALAPLAAVLLAPLPPEPDALPSPQPDVRASLRPELDTADETDAAEAGSTA
jgi:glycosyltransferase involved in cell wall biosynthesis